jgi:putative endonuclease
VSNKRLAGSRYEEMACSYLRAKGYRILDRNVCLLRKEIDIIASDEDTIVFVEVKGRRSEAFGSPLEAVGHTKRRHILAAASAYLRQKGFDSRPCRFDVVSVTEPTGEEVVLEHVENAFDARG